MSKIDDLAAVFRDHVAVGWPSGSSGAQRVIMVVYDPADERALRKQVPLFEQAANAHNYRWRTVDITALFGAWLAAHRYREDYFEEPDMLRSGADERFSLHVAAELEAVLNRSEHDGHELVALVGAASLFGVTSLAEVLSRVERLIQGRLVVFFPGRYRDGRYRMLDARESWDYHAVAISAEVAGVS
jgi:hypothetical protein